MPNPSHEDFRRVPLRRNAAFFRLPGFAATVVAGACLFFGAMLCTTEARADSALASKRSTVRQPAAPAVVKIGNVSYTDARAWFARLGYQSTIDAEKQTLTLGAAAGRIVFTADSREAALHGLRVFLGEPVIFRKGVFYVATIDLDRFLGPILRPSQLAARPLRTIVIDPGHGGTDTGTQNKPAKLDEKVFTLDVAQRLQRLLADSGWRVLLTRTDDRFVPLPDRAEIANKAGADLFVSIHFNSVANNPTVRGTETYVLTPRFQRSTSSTLPSAEDKVDQIGNRHDAWSAVLGAQMHRHLLAKLQTEDRGYKRARFAVLRLVDCPAVLVEAGYLSNNAEARKLNTEAYRGDIAEALAAGIQAYASALATAKK